VTTRDDGCVVAARGGGRKGAGWNVWRGRVVAEGGRGWLQGEEGGKRWGGAWEKARVVDACGERGRKWDGMWGGARVVAAHGKEGRRRGSEGVVAAWRRWGSSGL
jgi:hypothetical protein